MILSFLAITQIIFHLRNISLYQLNFDGISAKWVSYYNFNFLRPSQVVAQIMGYFKPFRNTENKNIKLSLTVAQLAQCGTVTHMRIGGYLVERWVRGRAPRKRSLFGLWSLPMTPFLSCNSNMGTLPLAEN